MENFTFADGHANPETAAALVRAIAEMEMPAFDAQNTHFKQPYATLASFVAASRTVLAKHGFTLVQPLHTKEGNLCITTMLLHTSGDYLQATVCVPLKDQPQAMGATITYFRRYCLGSMLGLVGEPDDDAEMAVEPTRQPQPARPAAPNPARPAAPNPARPAPQQPAAPKVQEPPSTSTAAAPEVAEPDIHALAAMPYPTAMDGDATVLLPKGCTTKQGTTNGRQWVRFEFACVEVLPSGETAAIRVSTFDTKVADRMQAAVGSRVIAVVKEGKGSVLDLVRIVQVEQAAKQAAKQQRQQPITEVSDDDIPF